MYCCAYTVLTYYFAFLLLLPLLHLILRFRSQYSISGVSPHFTIFDYVDCNRAYIFPQFRFSQPSSLVQYARLWVRVKVWLLRFSMRAFYTFFSSCFSHCCTDDSLPCMQTIYFFALWVLVCIEYFYMRAPISHKCRVHEYFQWINTRKEKQFKSKRKSINIINDIWKSSRLS